jgi:hypothetical protein
MKKQFYYTLLNILIIISLSCSNDEIPSSIIVEKGKVTFSLEDKNYNTVVLGSNILGDWTNFSMTRRGTKWEINLPNPHKEVVYKFLIDGGFWKIDPLNSQKRKVPDPYKGYNSVVYFK